MVIGTDQHEVAELIVAAAAEPANVVCLAQLGRIYAARRPPADLALTGIDVSKCLDKFAITAHHS